MKNEIKLGRLVQCNCHHTCLPNSKHGFQWLLPRTKSKHMLYQQVQQNHKNTTVSVDQIQQQLLSFSLLNKKTDTKKIKKKRNFKMSILLEMDLKKKMDSGGNTVLKEFFVKSSYN
ncbi:hypothetical protein INT48_004245 [Thamnidium elegans]|uniref:Uncharacterized protein n=1 Tax=Thamnidium elegans TaxID=101142 RepID=A0A8H7SME8_9FUNG|nr:hypothetical protein INT48_004245 [Thamnidium elegans]